MTEPPSDIIPIGDRVLRLGEVNGQVSRIRLKSTRARAVEYNGVPPIARQIRLIGDRPRRNEISEPINYWKSLHPRYARAPTAAATRTVRRFNGVCTYAKGIRPDITIQRDPPRSPLLLLSRTPFLFSAETRLNWSTLCLLASRIHRRDLHSIRSAADWICHRNE